MRYSLLLANFSSAVVISSIEFSRTFLYRNKVEASFEIATQVYIVHTYYTVRFEQ